MAFHFQGYKSLCCLGSLFVLIGLGLFIWVTVLGGSAVAFDIVAQHQSPIGSGLGPAGILLSSFGFFIAPAIIGALVGAIYLRSSQLSPGAVKKRMDRIESELQSARGRGDG